MRGSDEELLGMMPADSTDVAVVAYLDPGASQKVNLLRIADAFPDLGTREDMENGLRSALDEALDPIGLNSAVLDWVGVEAGIAVDLNVGEAEPTFVALIDTDDEDAAAADLEEARANTPEQGWRSSDHDGVEVWSNEDDQAAVAMVGGAVVVGNATAAVTGAIDAAHGRAPALHEAEAFTSVVSQLPESKLGLLYVDMARLAEGLRTLTQSLGGDPSADAAFDDLAMMRGFAMSLSAEPDGLAIDGSTVFDVSKMSDDMRAQLSAPDVENRLLGWVPGDAFAVAAVQRIDLAAATFASELETSDPDSFRQLERLGVIGSDGLLSNLSGDVVFEGGPDETGRPGVAAIIGTDDAAVARRTLDALARLALSDSLLASRSGVRPFAVSEDSGTAALFRSSASPWRSEDYRGVTIVSLVGPVPAGYAVTSDGTAIVATSPEHIKRVIDTNEDGADITEDPGFTAAVSSVPTSAGMLYVDVQRARDAIRAALPPDTVSRFDEAVIVRNLGPIAAVVVGAEGDQDHQRFRVLVRIP
jgi:hypothetical protein